MSRKTRKRETTALAGSLNQVAESTPHSDFRLLDVVAKRPLVVCLILLIIATVRICLTYSIYSHTIDEPAHIGTGMQWIDKHTYKLEPQHPPLARVMAAVGPYLTGDRSLGLANWYDEGAAILYGKGNYWRTLTLARMGILPFLWIAGLVVFYWAKRVLSPLEAVLAVFLFSMLPPILAHSGLATTDMGLAAFVGLSFLCGLWFFERPTLLNAAYLGGASGLAVLSKFSAPVFLLVSFTALLVAYEIVRRPSPGNAFRAVARALPLLAVSAVVAALVIWAGYRFSYGDVVFRNHGNLTMKLPAPELFVGLQDAGEHFQKGHPAYLLGERSENGWWYYYLVVLAVKTPVVFLLLLAGGIALNLRKPKWRSGSALCFSLAIIAFGFFNTINIGVRHILPVYIGFSIVGAEAAYFVLRDKRKWVVTTATIALAYFVVNSIAAHPDYLPYFNEFVGKEPEKILDDSDLDWGQDVQRAANRLQEVGARSVAFQFFVLADYSKHGFPPLTTASPRRPTVGWNLVSITVWKSTRLGLFDKHPEYKLWPDLVPIQERIGKGMLLYYFRPPQNNSDLRQEP